MKGGEQKYSDLILRLSNTFPSSTCHHPIGGAPMLGEWSVAKIIARLKPYFKKESKKTKR